MTGYNDKALEELCKPLPPVPSKRVAKFVVLRYEGQGLYAIAGAGETEDQALAGGDDCEIPEGTPVQIL